MVCEKCLKTRATIHLAYLDGCRRKELHVCEAYVATLDHPFPLAPAPRPELPPAS
jgi:protein-arginine kinase activator protein McsA